MGEPLSVPVIYQHGCDPEGYGMVYWWECPDCRKQNHDYVRDKVNACERCGKVVYVYDWKFSFDVYGFGESALEEAAEAARVSWFRKWQKKYQLELAL